MMVPWSEEPVVDVVGVDVTPVGGFQPLNSAFPLDHLFVDGLPSASTSGVITGSPRARPLH